MGRSNKGTTHVRYEDVYESEESSFEASNPLLFGESGAENDLDEDEDAAREVEAIPSGINIPQRIVESRNFGKVGKKSRTRRRSTRSPLDYDELLARHELMRHGSSDSSVDPEEEEDDERETDEFVRKSRAPWLSWFSLSGMGGGAMSSVVIAALFVPALAVNLVPGVPYAAFGQFLFLPFFAYMFVSMPVLLGWVLAFALRYLGPLNGFPFEVGAISLTPWIKDWRLYVRLLVQDAAFGNPPGFPFESFVQCSRLDMEASIPFRHLWNLVLLRKEKVPLKRVPDFERFIKFDFHHVEVDDAMVNFQMFDGKFNVNEFTRILANGEVAAKLPRRAPMPNQLKVRILRATNLVPPRLKKTCDPYVVVRVRRQSEKTHTQNQTLHPMWNETLTFHVDDASAVIEVAVYDRDAPQGNQAAFLGHWIMTTKYLVTDPTFCWHLTEDFKPYTFRKPAADGSTGFRGWVPLASKKWKRMGMCGQVELEVLWSHVPEEELENPYVPERRYTALEQLTLQSNEDQLRFGDWARFRDWLNHEPFSFDIRRFTVRGTRFYVQDLFRGHQGKPETLVRSNMGAEGADCVKLPILEMRKQFRPKGGDEGITCYDCFMGFFIGLMTSAAGSGRLGSALAQILSGGLFNFGYKFKSLLTGQMDRALVPLRTKQIKGVATLAKSGFAVVHQNVTQSRRNREQFKIAVEADDSDFLMAEVAICGHMDRCAVKVRGDISNSAMAAMAHRRGNFKTKYFELKGDTLFYRRHRIVPKGVTYNLTYKISLALIYSAVYVREYNELLLNVQEENHVVRLRTALSPATEPEKHEVRTISEWVRELRARDIPVEEV